MTDKILEKSLDVANKTMDLTNKVYDDGISKPVKTIGNGLNMCLKFLGSAISPTMYKYIQNAEYKMKEIDKKLSEKYNSIPEEKRVNPRMNIMGPAVELLKYNLDEEHIKEIFVNIMTCEMNCEKQNEVLPSYIDTVRQLNKEDAKFLKSVMELYEKECSFNFVLDIVTIRDDNSKGYISLDKYIIDYIYPNDNVLHTIKLNPVVIDNLTRLELIRIQEDKFIPNMEEYEIGFNYIKNNYPDILKHEIFYKKAIFQITDYGLKFLNICFDINEK